MKDAARIKIAALVTALFFGLLTAAGLAERPSQPPHATAAAPTQSAPRSLAGAVDDDGAGAPSTSGFLELEDD